MNVHGQHGHERALDRAATAVDFELTPAEADEVTAHVASCRECARAGAALRADAASLRAQGAILPSRRVDDAVIREIQRDGAPRQQGVLLVAAALLLLALLGTAAVGGFLRDSNQQVPVTVLPSDRPALFDPTTPPSQAVANPTADASETAAAPTPDPSAAVPGESWQQVDFEKADGVIRAAALRDSALVGVGAGGCLPRDAGQSDCYAAAWTARVGGDSWTRAPDQDGLKVGVAGPTSGPEKGLLDVAFGPAGAVAIGYAYDREDGGPGVWLSADGRTWQRVETALGALPDGARFSAIAANDRGYVIVGAIVDRAGPAARAAAWTSPNGVEWTRSVDTAGMDVGPCIDTGEEPACEGMAGVTWTGEAFAAVGAARSSAGAEARAAAWTSPDGGTWTRSDSGLDLDGRLSAVTTGPSGVVAVGTAFDAGTGAGIAASSPDGSSWTVTRLPGATPLHGVASIGGWTFAIEVSPEAFPPSTGLQLWRTRDNLTWDHVSGVPVVSDAVAYGDVDIDATADRLLIVGSAGLATPEGFRNFAYVTVVRGSP